MPPQNREENQPSSWEACDSQGDILIEGIDNTDEQQDMQPTVQELQSSPAKKRRTQMKSLHEDSKDDASDNNTDRESDNGDTNPFNDRSTYPVLGSQDQDEGRDGSSDKAEADVKALHVQHEELQAAVTSL
eukprot:749258-Hanusia_phi.AAC.1